ncbi:MAG TPA: hypothetical protein VL068_03660 [Microthrixaceae bacterium]|nr:hypothetical protein [Microthrixaceae bacterium]
MDIWLFLHILSAIIAFGVLFSEPVIARAVPGTGPAFAKVGTYIQAPALLVLIATGIGRAYSMRTSGRKVFDEAWISVGFTVWIIMAVLLFLLVRAQRSESKAVAGLTGGIHLLLVVALWAMIWTPGSPG